MTEMKIMLVNQLDDFQKRQINEVSTYEVEVIDKPILYFIRRKLTKLQIKVQACKVIFSVVIFNREYLSKLIKPGLKIVVKGKFIKNFSIFSRNRFYWFYTTNHPFGLGGYVFF